MKLGTKVSLVFDPPSLADVRKQKRFNAFRNQVTPYFILSLMSRPCIPRMFSLREVVVSRKDVSNSSYFQRFSSVQTTRNWRPTNSIENTEISKLSDQEKNGEVEIGVLSCP